MVRTSSKQQTLRLWNKEELQKIDRKSRQIMTVNKELHPRSDVARIYTYPERREEEA